MPRRVSSRKLQDYVEGRLAREELTRIEDYLRENPDIAAQVEKLRDQARRMRKFGRALLSEDIPQRLSDIVPRKPK
jgi:anti-sigma factor RsiW